MSAAAARLVLLTREGCGLCDHLHEALVALTARHPQVPPWILQDVDEDPMLARRHGLDVPVLLLDGVKVCQHALDESALLRLLRPRPGAAQV